MHVIDLNWEQTIPIRHKVLWPNESPEFCRVEGDTEGLHFGVVINNEIVCVASVYVDAGTARLRKFATLSQFQGQGIGSCMLNHIVNKLKQDEISYLWFDARVSAVGFYQRLGFTSLGEPFYKNEIAYYKMYANL